MLVNRSELDPEKYYHCTSDNKSRNTWLTKGCRSIIYLGPNKQAPYVSEFVEYSTDSKIVGDIKWEVREATEGEKEWMLMCLSHKKLVPKPLNEPVEQVYQIF